MLQGKLAITFGGIRASPRSSPYRTEPSRCEMALRWPVVALNRHCDVSGSIYKMICIDQEIRTLSSAMGQTREWFYSARPSRSIPNALQEEVIWLKMCLGIGYAGIIDSISTFTSTADGYVLTGKVGIWSNQLAPARLRVDDSFIVRRAEIDTGTTTITVANQGTCHEALRSFACAQFGTFSRMTPGGRPMPKFDAVLNEVSFDLRDAQFTRLADMTIPDNETRHVEGADGIIRRIPGAPVGVARWSLWFVTASVIFILFLIVLLTMRSWGK